MKVIEKCPECYATILILIIYNIGGCLAAFILGPCVLCRSVEDNDEYQGWECEAAAPGICCGTCCGCPPCFICWILWYFGISASR